MPVPVSASRRDDCQKVVGTALLRATYTVDGRLPSFPGAFVVECEKMPRPLKAKFSPVAARQVNTLRNPPTPTHLEARHRIGRSYANS